MSDCTDDIDINIQLAENDFIDEEKYTNLSNSENKRKLLDKTKIVKQTWSIVEIYQKINDGKLILDPGYQRNPIWNNPKKVAFIESLFMGIIVPPIYVVEIPGDNILQGTKYEVVDGKQRLTTVKSFLNNEFGLTPKDLEYYDDIYENKKFNDIKNDYPENINEFLSSVLDIYVITANSPEFTKYDIFARLNKGSEKLKVNEIRKAIYRSKTLEVIEGFIHNKLEIDDKDYQKIFTDNDIKRFEDYGRFYKSIAYYIRVNINEKKVTDYNSRPREMINSVLSEIQKDEIRLDDKLVLEIMNETINLLLEFSNNKNKNYLVDACIYFAITDNERLSKCFEIINEDDQIEQTFVKSPSTTSNVNKRIERIIEIIDGTN